ncbi:MAG: HVO_0476 family zinc finger protein [Methanomassiliicoccales archaeon]
MEDELRIECPLCHALTVHAPIHIQRSPGGEGMVYTLRCSGCGGTSKHTFKRDNALSIRYVLSGDGNSRAGKFSLFESEFVSVGDTLYLGGVRASVTAIETERGRTGSAAATAIKTVWAREEGKKTVHVSVNQGARTFSITLKAEPEEEIGIGDVIETPNGRAAVTAIKLPRRVIRQGRAEASEIVRVYARMIK